MSHCRNIADSDVYAVAKYCKDLEQFDILGTNMVSGEAVQAYVVVFVVACYLRQISLLQPLQSLPQAAFF